LQETPHAIKKRLKYKNPDSPLYRQTIDPADGLVLTFPHLSDEEIALLRRKGVIAPLSDKDVKEIEVAAERLAKAEKAAIEEAEKLAATNDKLKEKAKAAAAKKTAALMNATEQEQSEVTEDGENN
jgi:hypothetical protein